MRALLSMSTGAARKLDDAAQIGFPQLPVSHECLADAAGRIVRRHFVDLGA
jgi:hypothetical protein